MKYDLLNWKPQENTVIPFTDESAEQRTQEQISNLFIELREGVGRTESKNTFKNRIRSFFAIAIMLSIPAFALAPAPVSAARNHHLPPPPPPQKCTYIPGTSTPVGAACLSRSSFPALNNPVNPVSKGADSTGNTDSTQALQKAVNAGDVYISTPGTYLVNGGRGVWVPSNRTIECAPGVTLKTTLHTSSPATSGIFIIGAVSNVTIAGCDFQGGNTGSGAKQLDNNQGNFLIYVTDSSSILIEGNTFENTFANSAIQFATGSTGPGVTNSTMQYNTFSGNPYYGPAVTSGTNDVIQNNLSIDGPVGVEDDGCSTEPIGNITIQNNKVQVIYGDCAVASPPNGGCDSGVFITGGEYPPNCDYSTNVVKANYCTGASAQPANIMNNAPSGGRAAQYSNDILGLGCSCVSGTHC